ncbi:MAG TPA: 2-oxoacid:acceptor oxidoreductase family protein [Ilumatobacteraceae bacterium]|jgi:Pyruvate/2-oxoacid:ferredoxin oxidoreductase gamma subunit
MSERVLSIVLTGRGGQGVKLSSELLAWSASAEGFNPIQYSVYGALIRGGEIACSLAASRHDPGVPLRNHYELMCAMHNDWFDRYYPLIVPGGLFAFDVANIDASALTRSDIEHLAVPVAEMAKAAGDPRSGNMVVAGVVARLTGLASPDSLTKGMSEVVPPHRADRIARNLVAVDAGYSWVDTNASRAFDAHHLS